MAEFNAAQQAEIKALARSSAAYLMGIPFDEATGKTVAQLQTQDYLTRVVK